MKQIPLLAALLLFCLGGVVRAEGDAPKSERWMLTLQHGPLRIVSYRTPEGRTVAYHYMTLKVTNGTSLPRDWYPLVKAITDTGRTTVAIGREEALDAIREQENDYDLVPVAKTQGKLAAGKTIDTVAILGPLDPLYDQVKVQVFGLADPIAIYKLERWNVEMEEPPVEYTIVDQETGEASPVTTGITIQDVAYLDRNKLVQKAMQKAVGEGEIPKPEVQYWEVRERRAYEMVFSRPGDEFRAADDLISPVKEGWDVVGDVRLERRIQM